MFKTIFFNFLFSISISNNSNNYTNGDFSVIISSRQDSSSLLDIHKTLLLVPSNETSLGSLMTLGNQTMHVSPDEIKQSICPSTVDKASQIKRSVQTLQLSGLLPKHSEAVIKCPSDTAKMCLNLKDDDASSE